MVKHAVILCGGKSTRFESSTHKFLSKIDDVPFIQHLADFYFRNGCSEISLAVGDNYEDIVEWAESFSSHCLKINCVYTGSNSGTAKRIAAFKNIIDTNFFLTYADALSDVDIGALTNFHYSNNYILTITGIHPTLNFGVITCNSNNHVTGFIEKPKLNDLIISGGFFICNPAIFYYLPDFMDVETSFEKEIIPKIINDNNCGVYIHDGFWKCLDTQKDYQEFKEIFECTNL